MPETDYYQDLMKGAAAPAGQLSDTDWYSVLMGGEPEAKPTPPPAPETAEDTGNPVADAASWIGRTASSAYQGVKDLVTGDARREFDYPELPRAILGMRTDKGFLGSNLGFAQDDAARAAILKAAIPGAEISKDKFGNPIASIDGASYYINRPGLSMADLNEAGAQVVTSLPFVGLGGGVGGRLLGTLGRALGTGIGTATGSLATDAMAETAGAPGIDSEDMTRAAIAGAAGGAFELLSPAASALYRAVVRSPKFYDQASGKLTILGKMRLRSAGVDPDQVSDDFARKFADMANDVVDPRQAAVMAEAKSLPVEVPVTKGQATGKASDQMFESLAYKGAYGRGAENVMRGMSAKQQDALTANADEITRRIAGGERRVVAPGMGGQAVQDDLVRHAAAEKAGVDVLYDAARASGAGVPKSDVNALSHLIGASDEVASRLEFAPKAQAQLKALSKLGAGDDADTLVQTLFDWRRRTGTLAAETSDRTEAAALKAMVRKFDDALPEIVKDGLMSGDQTAVEAWKKAIAGHREFASKFRGGDLIEDLVDRTGKELTVQPEQAANYIFGVSDLGFVNKMTLSRDLGKIKSILGENSEAWNQLREEAFLRFMRSARGNYDHAMGTHTFSGAKFASAFNSAMERNPAVMRSLFSDEELKLIKQFKSVAQRVTTTSRGGDNFSNTTPAAANIIQRLMGAGFIGNKAKAAILTVGRPAVNILNEIRARLKADYEAPLRQIAPGLTGLGGATVVEPLTE